MIDNAENENDDEKKSEIVKDIFEISHGNEEELKKKQEIKEKANIIAEDILRRAER